MKKYFPGKNLGDKYSHCKKITCWLLAVLLSGSMCCGCSGAAETVAETVSEAVERAEGSGQAGDENPAQSGDENSVQNEGSSVKETDEDGSGSTESADGTEAGAASGNMRQDDEEGTETTGRRDPVKVKGIYVSGPVAGIAKMDTLIDLVDQTELNAMVIDIKNDEGKVTYQMQSEQVLEIDSGVGYQV